MRTVRHTILRAIAKYSNTRTIVRLGLTLCAVAIPVLGFALTPIPVHAADISEFLATALATVLSFFVAALGKLLLGAIYILTQVAQYNGFIDAPAIVNGWVITRDLANMFFIVVLLIAAFATIIPGTGSSYSVQSTLPKLIIAALLINFSKTIAGIFIDISQVVMLTFVNGFAAAAGGNFAQMFQMQHLLALDPNSEADIVPVTILAGYILAFVMLAIALATVVVMLILFVFRIVMLWALVVLSPLPYLLSLIPAGKPYADRWWKEFTNYLIVGPVYAFFLWLALVSAGTGNLPPGFQGPVGGSAAEQAEFARSTTIPTGAGNPNALLTFVISISMLLAGLKIGGDIGVAGKGAAGSALGWMKRQGTAAAKKAAYYGSGAAAARALATRGIESQGAQDMLNRVAASRIPLVNNLALRGANRIADAKKKRAEEAQKLMGSTKDVRVLGRFANPLVAFSPTAIAQRDAARKRAPSTIQNDAQRRAAVGALDDKALLELSAGELNRIQVDMTDEQRLDVARRGSRAQQRAVADLTMSSGAIAKSYQDWLADQEDAAFTTRRAAGMPEKDARRQAKRDVRGRVPPPAAAPPPGYTTSTIDTKYAAEFDRERQQRTQGKVDEYTARGEDFHASSEYLENVQQFYSLEEHSENVETAASLERQRASEGYDEGAVSGLRKLLARADQAAATPGAPEPAEARLAIDFSMLGMSGNGAHLTGASKDDAIQKIGTVLRNQGVPDADVVKVQAEMGRSKALNLINKGRDAGSARYTIAHESIHGQLEEVDPSQLRTLWESIADDARKAIVQKVRDEWKNPEMPEDEAMHEYFTDGMANATQWKRAGGFDLPPEVRAQLKALGVRFSAQPRGPAPESGAGNTPPAS